MTDRYLWRGALTIDLLTGEVSGVITDPMGYTIALTGKRENGAYALIGTPGPVPEHLWLPGDDP